MSSKESRLRSCLEAQKAGHLHPDIIAQFTSSAEGSAVLSRGSSAGADSRSPIDVRMPMGHVGTRNSFESQMCFADANQTIVIYDWDDTLCPSTCMRRYAHFDKQGRLAVNMDRETRSELNMLADQVIPLMRLSQSMGKVVIVTNAKRPWVDISCSNFLPQLKGCLQNVPVIYALELVKDAVRMDTFDKDNGALLTETKARAMKAAVSQFYSRYPHQSWKNIVSIGDAQFEHTAVRQVVGDRPSQKRCRTKTIKLLEGPTIAGMVVQLSIVESWLTKIIQIDSDVDIDLSANEETVNNWVLLFGDTTS